MYKLLQQIRFCLLVTLVLATQACNTSESEPIIEKTDPIITWSNPSDIVKCHCQRTGYVYIYTPVR
jgi:hypothetical protein